MVYSIIHFNEEKRMVRQTATCPTNT